MTPHLLCIYPWLTWGGADTFNLDMLGCLAQRGWRFSIVTTVPSRHAWRDRFARFTDDITDLAATPPDQAPARLLQLVQSRPISTVLVSHSACGYAALPYLRAHAPQLACADYCHVAEGDGHYARISVEQRALLDVQITSSAYLQNWMVAHGGDRARIAVCTTNVDADDWNPARFNRAALRRALALPHAGPVVLYAARLDREKQPILALRVMRAVARRVPNAHFLVAGDGRFGNFVRGFVRWHRLEQRIHVLGAVSSERMRELLAASDVLFLPSAYEGVSLAVYEAMAMGVVPLSVASSGQPELVTPDCGTLVTHGSDEEATYTAALLALLQDRKRREQMGRAARERITVHFRLEQMGERMHELLCRAQQQRQPVLVTPQAARASAQRIVATLRADAALYNGDQSVQSRYTRLLERGPWWVAPLAERVRALVRSA